MNCMYNYFSDSNNDKEALNLNYYHLIPSLRNSLNQQKRKGRIE